MSNLYDDDIVLWSEEQARALRAAAHSGANLPIDWENVAEEIESLGASDKRELRRRIGIVLIHLMKLQASPAIEPRAGWRETIREQRDGVTVLLEDSPSLEQFIPEAIRKETGRARRRVRDALADHGETPRVLLDGLTFTEEQVLGPWLPGDGP